MSSNIPPSSSSTPNPSVNPNEATTPSSSPAQPATESPFAKLFPVATPDQVNQITAQFINFTINQMKADQQQMLQALQQMQQDIESGTE